MRTLAANGLAAVFGSIEEVDGCDGIWNRFFIKSREKYGRTQNVARSRQLLARIGKEEVLALSESAAAPESAAFCRNQAGPQ
jgi:hypothetical protein